MITSYSLKRLEEFWSLEMELKRALQNGKFTEYLKRAEGESGIYLTGEKCGWDRETMVQYCLSGPSGFLGRKTFEKSFDGGKMISMAETYHKYLMMYRSEC